MDLVLKELEALSCRNEEVSEAMFYTLKRKDKEGNTKLIQGPSVRFAEVLVYCWRNTRSDKGISNVDAEFVTGQGIMFDLERNNALKVETKRRITDRNGRRYNADMIQTTGNASSSLSYRNAVTSVIPQALWMPILEKAKKVAVGGTASVNERRNIAIEYGKKVGVSPDQIFSTLNVQGVNDIGIDELVTLKGLFNALKEGEMTIEEAFGDPFEKELNELFDKLGHNRGRREALIASYKGRSADLLAYLREQAKPLGETKKEAPTVEEKPKETPKVEEKSKETAVQEIDRGGDGFGDEAPKPKVEEAAAEVKRGRGRPPGKKNTEHAEAEVATEPVTAPSNPHFKDGTYAPEGETKAEEKLAEKTVEKKPEPEPEPEGSFNF